MTWLPSPAVTTRALKNCPDAVFTSTVAMMWNAVGMASIWN